MGLHIRRTAMFNVPGHGTVIITPNAGRKTTKIDAPESLDITDKKGRPMSHKRKKKLTPPDDL